MVTERVTHSRWPREARKWLEIESQGTRALCRYLLLLFRLIASFGVDGARVWGIDCAERRLVGA